MKLVLKQKKNLKEEQADVNPKNVLRQLGIANTPYLKFYDAEAVADGTFAGSGGLTIENGNVILIRFAQDEEHLIKRGLPATPDELNISTEHSGGAYKSGAVHTSADIKDWQLTSGRVKGLFKIPVEDFLQLGKQGKIILGNLGEREINLSGDVAKKYLDPSSVEWIGEKPEEVYIDL